MQDETSNFLEFAKSVAKESAKILIEARPNSKIAVQKDNCDYALDADLKSEQHILKRINEKYPQHSILTEESGFHDKNSQYLWVIDPLEGTLNYKNGLALWAVNIALFKENEPILGVIYAPDMDEMYTAERGKGSKLNGKKISVSGEEHIEKSFYAGSVKHLQELNLPSKILRALGCCGIELAYVACGKFGARIRTRGKDPYGYGAGSILVLEAGGKITDTKGQKWTLESEGVIASNSLLHEGILKLL